MSNFHPCNCTKSGILVWKKCICVFTYAWKKMTIKLFQHQNCYNSGKTIKKDWYLIKAIPEFTILYQYQPSIDKDREVSPIPKKRNGQNLLQNHIPWEQDSLLLRKTSKLWFWNPKYRSQWLARFSLIEYCKRKIRNLKIWEKKHPRRDLNPQPSD